MFIRTSPWLLVSVLSLASAAACAKKTPEPEAPAPAAGPAAAAPAKEGLTEAAAIKKISENLRRVHFAYDSDQMNEDSKEALRENARLLLAHPNIMVEVEGHCDQRGTSEYNLALGQRRADAVQKYLVRAGVPASHIRTVSFGMERPVAEGEGDSVWAQNRRAEFRVTTVDGVAELRGSVD